MAGLRHGRQRRRTASVLTLSVMLAVGGVLTGGASAAKDETELISRQSVADGGAGGDADSLDASLSADGRYVAFASTADNLSPDDDDAVFNVFVRDLQTGTTTLVSRRSAADGGAGGDGDSYAPAISADGRYVAFPSDADNLSTADGDAYTNIFVRDLQAGATTLVSRQSAADGGAGADGNSYDPAISADGRHVAFESGGDNLSAVDDDAAGNVFVRDRQTNATILVSRRSAADGGAGASGSSGKPAISADGRRVAFQSMADDLSTADADGVRDVFVRDLETATTTLVSRQGDGDGGAGGDGESQEPSISADGSLVAFYSVARNLSGLDDDAGADVFVRDLRAGTTTLASRQSALDGGAGADGYSYAPALSADGRHVAFVSYADNLGAAGADAFTNVFVRDLQAESTTLVSRQSALDGGAGADAGSYAPAISADGRYAAFSSEADNLSALDSDGISDVFRRDVLGPPPPVPAAPPEAPPGPPPAPPGAPPAPPAAAGAPDTTAPAITRLTLSNRTFAVGPGATPVRAAARTRAKTGTRIRFSLSEPADVRIDISRVLAGRSVRGRCVAPTRRNRRNKRCTRYRAAGTLRRAQRPAGANVIPFSGRIGRRALRAGGHRATLTATDAAGNRSRARSVRFTIVSARR